MASDGKHLNTFAQEEHDNDEYRKRVATYVDGSTVSYEDTGYVEGDSPVVLDVFGDLGRIAHEGYLINDGPGNLLVEMSANGTTYGGQHTLRTKETLVLSNSKVKKLRLTWAQNTAYRALIA